MSKTVLILGAASAIAQAYVRRRCGSDVSFILLGRTAERLNEVACDLVARGAAAAAIEVRDLADRSDIAAAVNRLFEIHGSFDEVMLAYGSLGGAEISAPEARELIDTNFAAPSEWLLAVLKRQPPDAPLTLIVITSVAADRGRKKNPLYGATKAGLDVLMQGLQHAYDRSNVSIVIVKPGPIDTPMTNAFEKGVLWSTADRVASDILRAVKHKRRIVYSPWYWQPIMFVIRNLPWWVFRRLNV